MVMRADCLSSSRWKGLAALLAVHILWCGWAAWRAFTGDFDTGTVELMAVNIARGEDYPLFWYGLHYAGALEAYLAALFIKIFGFSELHLCLSPIFFSTLWILGTYLLFAEIFDYRAGMTAALASVFPSYFLHYYCYALSGGYSVVLGLGTLIFWLGVRILNREPTGFTLWLHVLAIGILSALAIWVHFFVFPYLLVTAVLLLAYWRKRHYAWTVFFCYLTGALIAALGLVPFFWVIRSGEAGGSVAGFLLHRQHVLNALQVLWTYDLLKMVTWKVQEAQLKHFAWIFPLYIVLLSALCIGMLLVVRRRCAEKQPLAAMSPILFMLFFLGMFLFHRMAVIPSPRYVLGLWAIFTGMAWACFAVWSRGRGAFFWLMLLFWIGYNGLGSFFFVHDQAPIVEQHRKESRETVGMARARGLGSVILLGDDIYGFSGQKLSAFAGNAIHFVSSDKERYQRNAQQAESDPAYGLMCSHGSAARVMEALKPLDVRYMRDQSGGNVLFHHFSSCCWQERSALTEARIVVAGQSQGVGGDLVDRNISTGVSWQGNGEGRMEIVFPEERLLTRITFFGMPSGEEGKVVGLPVSYRVEGAGRDAEFAVLKTFNGRVNQSYIQAGHVYVSGYFGKSECRFPPRRIKRLRVIFTPGQKVRLSEIGLYVRSGRCRFTPEQEVQRIVAELSAEHAAFALADRWLSSRLIAEQKTEQGLPALPRFNPRFAVQEYSRVLVPNRSLALVVDRSIADECRQLITEVYGAESIRKRTDLSRYSLLFFNDTARDGVSDLLYWNGHILVRMSDFRQMASINLRNSGIGVIDPVHQKAKGFYRDGWTDGNGRIYGLHVRPGARRLLVLVTGGNAPFHGDPGKLRLSLRVNGQPVPLLRRDASCYLFRLPEKMDLIREVRLSSIAFKPGNNDWRMLGIDVRRFLVF